MYTLDRPIVAMKLTGLPQPSRRNESTRVCEGQGCSTVLSSYNRRRRCWLHQPVRYPVSPMLKRAS